MMKRMLKYAVPVDGESHPIDVPDGTVFRHADLSFERNGTISLWAEVPVSKTFHVIRSFRVVPTGFSEVPDTYEFVATVVDFGRNLVWHIFEMK